MGIEVSRVATNEPILLNSNFGNVSLKNIDFITQVFFAKRNSNMKMIEFSQDMCHKWRFPLQTGQCISARWTILPVNVGHKINELIKELWCCWYTGIYFCYKLVCSCLSKRLMLLCVQKGSIHSRKQMNLLEKINVFLYKERMVYISVQNVRSVPILSFHK